MSLELNWEASSFSPSVMAVQVMEGGDSLLKKVSTRFP